MFDQSEIEAMLEAEPETEADRKPPEYILEIVESAYGGACDIVQREHVFTDLAQARRCQRAYDAMLRARRERFIFTRIELEKE